MTSSDDTNSLIQCLGHHNPNTRYLAETQLRRLGADAVPSLMRAFESEWQKFLAVNYRGRRLAVCAIVSGMLMSLTLIALSLAKVIHGDALLFMTPWLLGCSLSVVLYRAKGEKPRRLSALYDLLLEMKSPRMVGMLLEMYAADPTLITRDAHELLRLHFPHITPLEWTKLTQRQHKAFYRLVEQRAEINTTRCYEFAVAGLKALEQVGDAEAIPTVQHIAKHGSNNILRNTAKECLPYLETRRDEDAIRQTLLRASQSSGGKDELLRVPTHAPDTESEQLLRMPREK